MTSRAEQLELVLYLLRQVGDRGITNGEFLDAGCGARYGGRIYELREQGHIIEVHRESPSCFRYQLTHDAGDVERSTSTPDTAPPDVGTGAPPAAGGSLDTAGDPLPLFGDDVFQARRPYEDAA